MLEAFLHRFPLFHNTWFNGAVIFIETARGDGDTGTNKNFPALCLGGIRGLPAAGKAEIPSPYCLHWWQYGHWSPGWSPSVSIILPTPKSIQQEISRRSAGDRSQAFYILLVRKYKEENCTPINSGNSQTPNCHVGINWYSPREHLLLFHGGISEPPSSLSGTIPCLLRLAGSL